MNDELDDAGQAIILWAVMYPTLTDPANWASQNSVTSKDLGASIGVPAEFDALIALFYRNVIAGKTPQQLKDQFAQFQTVRQVLLDFCVGGPNSPWTTSQTLTPDQIAALAI